jgi:hypothetical protein
VIIVVSGIVCIGGMGSCGGERVGDGLSTGEIRLGGEAGTSARGTKLWLWEEVTE